MSETWRSIPGCLPEYQINRFGKVWVNSRAGKDGRTIPPRFLKISPGEGNYQYVTVRDYRGKGRMVGVHRLVARAFIPNPLNLPTVNHKDGNPANNHVDNLEWMTVQENVLHGVNVLNHGVGEVSGRAYITKEQAAEILRRLSAGERQSDLARELKVSASIVSAIYRGKHWSSRGYLRDSQRAIPRVKFTKETNRDTIPGEVWRPISGYEGRYEVSDHTRVWSCAHIQMINGKPYNRKAHLMKVMKDCDGYLLINLHKDRKQRCVRVANLMRDAGFSLDHYPAGCR